MKKLQLTLLGIVALSAASSAQSSPSSQDFVKRFSHAVSILESPTTPWPWRSFDDIGETLLPLSLASDAILAESFNRLDREKDPKRTIIGDVLLILLFEVKVPMTIENNCITYGSFEDIRDGLENPYFGGLSVDPAWPWVQRTDRAWALEPFCYRFFPAPSLASRLELFRHEFKRRIFDTKTKYTTGDNDQMIQQWSNPFPLGGM